MWWGDNLASPWIGRENEATAAYRYPQLQIIWPPLMNGEGGAFKEDILTFYASPPRQIHIPIPIISL